MAGTMPRLGAASKYRHSWHHSKLLRVVAVGMLIGTVCYSFIYGALLSPEVLLARKIDKAVRMAARNDNMNKDEGPKQCIQALNTAYEGDQISWGFSTILDKIEDCEKRCIEDPKCNIFSWCAAETGCGGSSHPKGACWTKHLVASPPDLTNVPGKQGADVPFISGVCYPQNRRHTTEAKILAENLKEEYRLGQLKRNTALPLVYFDVSIKGQPAGRMEFVLFTDKAPRAAESYRLMFSGEVGKVPEGRHGAGLAYSFTGARFYRIIHGFIDQGGVETDSPLPKGGPFKDDPGSLELLHDRKGLLSIANSGPDTNTVHFSIMQGPFAHNNKHYGVFGEMVSGWDVSTAINRLSHGAEANEVGGDTGAIISASGQLRRGTPVDAADFA